VSAKRDILFLCQFYHPEYISSAQLPYDTVKALTAAGFSVDVLCGYPREYGGDKDTPIKENLDGIRIRRLKYIQLTRSGFAGRLINYFSFTFMVMLNLWRAVSYRAVVVYSNPPVLPWIASWAKVLFGTKLIFVAYDLYPEMATLTDSLRQGGIICRLMEHINRVVYKRSDHVVTLSTRMREFILENRPIEPSRVSIIPNWYQDKGALEASGKPNAFAEVTGGRFTVSYFGNMGVMQDMQTILDAVRSMREEPVFFLFAGHGNKMEGLKQALSLEGLANARVYDFLHGQDFQDALRISDCALVSLVDGGTGLCCPSKTYSYMMQGIPLLAIMDEDDIVWDIQQGAGMWVRNGDSEGLCRAIRAMRDNSEEHKQMRHKCRALYLEKYTTEICTQKYVSLFRELLAAQGNEEDKK